MCDCIAGPKNEGAPNPICYSSNGCNEINCSDVNANPAPPATVTYEGTGTCAYCTSD